MNKTEFIRSLADEYELDRASAKTLVNMVLTHLKQSILDSQRVILTDFGVFTTVFKKERRVANNLNLDGGELLSGARLVLKFRPSKSLKRLLKQEGELMDDDDVDECDVVAEDGTDDE